MRITSHTAGMLCTTKLSNYTKIIVIILCHRREMICNINYHVRSSGCRPMMFNRCMWLIRVLRFTDYVWVVGVFFFISNSFASAFTGWFSRNKAFYRFSSFFFYRLEYYILYLRVCVCVCRNLVQMPSPYLILTHARSTIDKSVVIATSQSKALSSSIHGINGSGSYDETYS